MKTCYAIKCSTFQMAILDMVPYCANAVDPSGYYITRINVPTGFRGKGIGRELLADCLGHADKEGITLYLVVQAQDDSLTHEQLREWYMRHGFKEIGYEGMFIRKPKGG